MEASIKKTKEDTAGEQEVIASRISLDTYRNLISHLPQRIFIKDLNSVYISCNERYALDLGITPEQITGKDDFAFHPEEIAIRYRVDDQEVICSGQPKIIDEPYFIKGKEHWVHINKIPYYDDNNNIVGVIGVFEDITERRNTEEELKVSEFKFRDIYDNAIEGMYRTSVSGKSLMANNALANMLGFNSVNEYLSAVIDSDHQVWLNEEDRSAYIALLKKQDIVKGYECQLIQKDGTPIWVLLNAKAVKDEYGNMIYSEGFMIDISERKLAEDKLQKANRLYAVISQVNQMIVYTKDRDKLFKEICRIAIDFGKFRMAWIGLVDENNQKLKPIAFAGHEEGYLTEIEQIFAGIGLEGHAPISYTILEGSHIVCADFETDPDVQIWRKEALKRDYHSSISLPIKLFGKVIGAYTLYSSIPNFFDQQEIELFTEVAGDISFALETIEMEQQHGKAEAALAKREEQLRGIFDNLQDVYIQSDSSGILTMLSPSAVVFYGYQSMDEIIGLPAVDLYAFKDDRETLLTTLRSNGNVRDMVCKAKRKDGTTFWVSMNIHFRHDLNGNIIGLEGIVRDISERIKAEEETIRIKKRFQTMFEQAPMGITLSDSFDDRILEINGKYADILGRTKNEIIETGWKKITHPGDLQEDIANLARVNSGEIDHYQMKKRYIRSDGSVVWVNMILTSVSTEDKDHPQNLCMIEDITERINNEEKIRILSNAIDQSPVSVVITDRNGNIEYVNPKFSHVTGYSADEVIGKNPRILKSNTKSKEDYSQLWNNITSGFEWRGEFLNVKKSGELFNESASISPIFDENGVIAHFIGVKEDITERKMKEAQIQMLSALVEQSPLMVNITDKSGKINFINAEFTSFTQYTKDEILGTIPRIFKQKHHTREAYEMMWKTLQNGKVWQTEFRNRKKDGTEFWENVTIFPLSSDQELITNYILIKENITEKKKLIDDLIKAKEKAEESDRLKSAFLANMSHEIRTPMNGILGFTELLKEPKLTGEEQKLYIQIIEESGFRMLNLMNDIIDISKIESGEVKILISTYDIHKQFDYIFNFFNKAAEQKGLKLIVRHALLPNESTIATDGPKLDAILINLVKNAIKFTMSGTVEFGCEKQGKYYRFFVKDSGVGIDPVHHGIIFERFRQASESLDRPYEGAGLGLAISKAYVEMLGGKIWVESEIGKGSVFNFSLPSAVEGNREISDQGFVANVAIPNPSPKIKMLIVEDDDVSLNYLEIIVKNFCDKIFKARTGVEAIETFRNNQDINLILMDIKMPGMDGYEATRQIRKLNQEVIVIAQTAYSLAGDEKKALDAGCNDYITKPVNKAELIAKMKSHFEKK